MPAVQGVAPADSAFAGFLAKTGWVVEYPGRRGERAREIPAWLRSAAGRVAGRAGDRGKSCSDSPCSPPRAKVEVNWEVRDLLKTAARRWRPSSPKCAPRGAARGAQVRVLNKMTAFVVHDLNLVAQLSLLLKNAGATAITPASRKTCCPRSSTSRSA